MAEICLQTLRAEAGKHPSRQRRQKVEIPSTLRAFAGGARDWTFVEFSAIVGGIVRAAQVRTAILVLCFVNPVSSYLFSDGRFIPVTYFLVLCRDCDGMAPSRKLKLCISQLLHVLNARLK